MKLHEIVDSTPLIWRLVTQQLLKGKRVLYHAHLPASDGGYMIGMIMNVFDDYASLRLPGSKKLTNIPFTQNDDAYLTMRPSNDTDVADFTVVDVT